MKLKYCEKGIKTNYYNTNEKQGQISFAGPEAHKIWGLFLKEKKKNEYKKPGSDITISYQSITNYLLCKYLIQMCI